MMDDTLADFRAPIGVMGVFVNDPNSQGGTLQTLHGLDKYPGKVGRADPDCHGVFGFLDDVQGIDIQSIKMTETVFGRTDEIEVADLIEKHNDLLAAEPDKAMVGPLDDTFKNRMARRTRQSMFIPYELCHLVVGKNITPREAWTILVPAIQAANLTTICQPLIVFLLVANTLPDGAQESLVQQSSPGVAGHPITPAVMQHRRDQVLHTQLPALRPQTGLTSDPALQ